jgi:metal-dependent amidase/aminoacylase/carboxypeptidase family protein
MSRMDMTFRGKPAHAAAAPWDGSSALRAVIHTFNLIDSARVHLRDGARVHGIITDGGQAVNIIPERAAAAFSVRAPTAAYLQTVMAEVRRAAEAAALGTGTTVEIVEGQGYRDMRNNQPLARRFGDKLAALGVPFAETDPRIGIGSTDMGDVSYEVPAIHPYMGICAPGEAFPHQHGFAARAASPPAMEAMRAAAKAMALLSWDVFHDPELLQNARAAFDAGSAGTHIH